jgi:hypothetical protein
MTKESMVASGRRQHKIMGKVKGIMMLLLKIRVIRSWMGKVQQKMIATQERKGKHVLDVGTNKDGG